MPKGANVTVLSMQGDFVRATYSKGKKTYTGYLIEGLISGRTLAESMERAARAAAVSVTRPGAADSIPWAREL